VAVPTTHRIRRQTWSLRAATPAEGFALRREVHEAWEAVLLPALERAFDEAADGERVIRIPRLDLRLRLDSPGELAEALPRLIREAIGAELRSAFGEIASARAGVAPAVDRLATLRHYLRTGSLPWAAAGGPREEVIDELRATAHAAWPRLLEALPGEAEPPSFAFRLLQLVGEPLPDELSAALPARVPPLWRRVVAALLAPAGAHLPLPARHARLELAAALLAEAISRPVADVADAVAELAERHGGPEARAAVAALLAPPPEAPRRRSRRRADSTASARPPNPSPPPGQWPREAGDEPTADGPPAEEAPLLVAEDGSWPERVAADPATEEEFGTWVASAGLVLLHPFLPALLQHTGLREGDAIPWRSLPRAAALLHYLATGREELLEMELGMAKLLLGLSPHASLPVAEGLLGLPDREECEALLRSVIGHWSVLKSTSPDGLRDAFLRRPGLLYHDDAGWTLRVEPAPFDLLLHHLPWSYGIVKLPWTSEPIYTEWATR
jgi:hypothetical protein